MVVQGKGGIGQKESRGKKIKNGYKETLRGEIYSFFELNQWIHGYIYIYIAVLCLVTQLCPTLFSPMDCSPPVSSVHMIHQARILEWVAMTSSRGSSQPRDQTQVSHIAGRFFTIWATRAAHTHTLSLLKLYFEYVQLIVYQLFYNKDVKNTLCVSDIIHTTSKQDIDRNWELSPQIGSIV